MNRTIYEENGAEYEIDGRIRCLNNKYRRVGERLWKVYDYFILIFLIIQKNWVSTLF